MNTEQLFKDKYRIIQKLGQGGMSKVFLAEHIQLNTLWAIKEIPKNQKHLVDLAAEPNAMKNLRHPSIPRIFDIHENEEFLYIIQDYIEGENLSDLIRREGAFKEERVLKWAKQIADVYVYLHNLKPNPLIYRDMKPSNLIIDQNDNIKVIDFGIAREYKEGLTEDTTMLGTRGYAAPEQHGGCQTDNRSDIYSLGITLYHLLTGISPNERTFDLTLLEKSHYISKEFTEIIEKCTQFNSEKRYQTSKALLEDLENIYQGEHHVKANKRYKVKGSTQIALIGVVNSCGLTHTTFMLANLLRKHYKVAVVEMNGSKDFEELQYTYSGDRDGKEFRIKNVDYYKAVSEEKYIEILNMKYDFLLLDLGPYQELYDIDTFLRTDIKVVMCHGSDWKSRHLYGFYKDIGMRDTFKEWKIFVPFIPMKHLTDFKEDFSNEVFSVPFNLNPFKLDEGVEKDLSKTLEKITGMKLCRKTNPMNLVLSKRIMLFKK